MFKETEKILLAFYFNDKKHWLNFIFNNYMDLKSTLH